MNDSIDLLDSKLSVDPDVNDTWGAGMDPSILVTRNQIDGLKNYLDHGGNANSHSPSGISLLDLAFQMKFESIIELLLQHGADPNQVNYLQRFLGWARSNHFHKKIKLSGKQKISQIGPKLNHGYL